MKTQDIKNIASAYMQVLGEKKLDKVNHDELKGTHAQRKDKDIDNDGDADKSDEYLHNRRKAISKAIKKEEMDKTKPCPKCDGSMDNHSADCPMAEGSKGNDDKIATSNPKQGKSNMTTSESTVYARILEKRYMHMKGATKPETWDDKYTGKGAKDMKKDHEPEINDMEEKGHQDAVSAGRAGPKAKARPNDNMKGDKSVINPPKEAK